jgi:hypothetical protein
VNSETITVRVKESCGTEFGNLYLGNKMSGVPYFNAPWFDQMAWLLGTIPGVVSVFNPAEHDREMGFEPLGCPNGSLEEARKAGFVARDALTFDWNWIGTRSNGLIVGPDWKSSPGTISEVACHQALRLPVWELKMFLRFWNQPEIKTPLYTLPGLVEQ